MVKSFLSDAEIECLRSLLGIRLEGIFAKTLEVGEATVRLLPPASVRLEGQCGFLLMKSAPITRTFDGVNSNLGYRPAVEIMSYPAEIPYILSTGVIPGPCSSIDLGLHFRVTSIDVFQQDWTVEVTDRADKRYIETTADIQMTIFRGEGSPLSIAAAGEALYVSRDMGLLQDRSLHLQRRLTLK